MEVVVGSWLFDCTNKIEYFWALLPPLLRKTILIFPGFRYTKLQRSIEAQLLQFTALGSADGEHLPVEHDHQLLHQLLHLLLHVLRLQGGPLRDVPQMGTVAWMWKGTECIRIYGRP